MGSLLREEGCCNFPPLDTPIRFRRSLASDLFLLTNALSSSLSDLRLILVVHVIVAFHLHVSIVFMVTHSLFSLLLYKSDIWFLSLRSVPIHMQQSLHLFCATLWSVRRPRLLTIVQPSKA